MEELEPAAGEDISREEFIHAFSEFLEQRHLEELSGCLEPEGGAGEGEGARIITVECVPGACAARLGG